MTVGCFDSMDLLSLNSAKKKVWSHLTQLYPHNLAYFKFFSLTLTETISSSSEVGMEYLTTLSLGMMSAFSLSVLVGPFTLVLVTCTRSWRARWRCSGDPSASYTTIYNEENFLFSFVPDGRQRFFSSYRGKTPGYDWVSKDDSDIAQHRTQHWQIWSSEPKKNKYQTFLSFPFISGRLTMAHTFQAFIQESRGPKINLTWTFMAY